MSRSARSAGPLRRILVLVLTVGLTALGLSAPQAAHGDTTPPSGVPATVSADGLPTWQINGVVWSQVVVGNTVYVTGSFSKARPPGVAVGGAGEIDAANIFAFDITTGNPVASFSHALNAQGLAVAASPDGSRIYVGGDFTTVDGIARGHLVAFDTATGALVANFAPPIGGQIRALATTSTTVYAGGSYTAVGNSVRNRLSAFDTAPNANGALRPWAPSADHTVWSLAMTPDKLRVIVGGSFATLSGTAAIGMGSTDAVSGEIRPWAANQVMKNSGTFGAITSLRSDATQVYGAGYTYGGGNNFEGTFAADPDTGTINWVNDCHGDTYDVLPIGQVLYSVNHSHDCSPTGAFPDTSPRVRWKKALAWTTYPTGVNVGPDSYGWDYNGIPASSLLQWFPDMSPGSYTGQEQAAWALAGNGSYVVVGGEFPTVNAVAQQGLVRFAVSTIAPKKRGPSYNTVPATPVPPTTAASLSAGTARVRFGTAWDMDNETLTYALIRDAKLVVGATKQLKTNFWTLPGSGFIDTGLVSGATHTYQVRITDPFGNTQYSAVSNPVTISSTALSGYAQDVIGDGAASYWRLGEPSGTSVLDDAGFADATAGSGVTRGETGAISGDPNNASRFSGSSTGMVGTNSAVPAPQTFTLEAWVRTTTNNGGQIIGFGGSRTGTSSSSTRDRQVYMDNNGRVRFGVNPGTVKAIGSTGTYRNGAWHHVVASLDNVNGMSLYVDGTRVANDGSTTSARVVTGYWRLGGDSLSGLPSRPSSGYLNGTIDDVAVYPTALTLTQIQRHYLAAGGTLPNQSPVASFTSSVVNLDASLDGSGSTDLEGPIQTYSWNFGDGTPAGTGVTPSHFYAAAGTYQVTLTVTDSQSVSSSVTRPVAVTVPPPNQDPTASFTSSAVHLVASFDGSVSSDIDGSVTSYSWDFGDGSPAGTGARPSHTYARTGAYEVTLTVTDNQSATGSVTQEVSVTAQNQIPTAAFTSTPTDLSVAFDGSGSADPDGTIASYSWNFGDGSAAGSGDSPTHVYAASGTYQVTLTVWDNQLASGTAAHPVSVASPPGSPVIVDTFGRTLASGWGSADTGGTWTGSTASLSVGGGTGFIRVAASGNAPSVFLNATTTSDADLTATLSSDKVGTGNGVYLFTVGRRVVGAGDYRLQTRLRADGLVGVSILRTNAAGAQTVIQAEATVPAYTFVAGNKLNVRFQVTGTSPTVLRAKVWPAATTEPVTWLRSASDSTAGLQVAGGVGFAAFLSGTGTNAPVITSFDDLYVRPVVP